MRSDHTTLLNSYAYHNFRDIAEFDYIAARALFKMEMHIQFLWMSLQSIEKYIKCIFLLNRISSRNIGHDVSQGLHTLYEQLDFPISISNGTANFIDYLTEVGANRYGEFSYYITGDLIHTLDRAVWEIRRYCQPISPKTVKREERKMYKDLRWYTLEEIRLSTERPPEQYKLFGGKIEAIRANERHPLRNTLLWKNFHFWTPCCTPNSIMSNLYIENSRLDLYPEMIPSLRELARISR